MRLPLGWLAVALAAAPATAQNSEPAAAAPMPVALPAPVDAPYPGTMRMAVDATNVRQGIVRVVQTIPVAKPGPLVLLYPKWLPGDHAPEGEAANLAGLIIETGGRRLAWRRDPIEVTAFHVEVPAGAAEVTARFDYLSARRPIGVERTVITPELMNLQWEKMSLYPAGYYVRRIPVTLALTLPEGWRGFTALRGTTAGTRTDYATVSYETLVDSPLFAGRHARSVALDPAVSLNIVGDTADATAIKDRQIAGFKALVVQMDRLVGTRHFDHYDFLLAASDKLSGIGLEHHRSSENSVGSGFFADWDDSPYDRSLLPHEYFHSWNGKFRRPADLWTPDYHTPMRDSLLWVYEGLTSFYEPVLATRSGLWSREEYLGYLADTAALYAEAQPGQSWRSLADTVHDPITTLHTSTSEWPSWSREYDYYAGAGLIWLEADQIIRQRSRGARSLDDFAKRFLGLNDGDWGTVTYSFDDVVADLNAVEPYDWASFLRTRLEGSGGAALLGGLAIGGYRLGWGKTPNIYQQRNAGGETGLDYSLGFAADADGRIDRVIWDGPAFRAGLRAGDRIVAVGDRAFAADALRDAVRAASRPGDSVELRIGSGDDLRTVRLAWSGGMRHPALEPLPGATRGIDALIAPK